MKVLRKDFTSETKVSASLEFQINSYPRVHKRCFKIDRHGSHSNARFTLESACDSLKSPQTTLSDRHDRFTPRTFSFNHLFCHSHRALLSLSYWLGHNYNKTTKFGMTKWRILKSEPVETQTQVIYDSDWTFLNNLETVIEPACLRSLWIKVSKDIRWFLFKF